MLHLSGFYEDIDAAAALVNITAIPDPVLFTQGDDLRVPSLNRVVVIAAGIGSGSNGIARLTSPSLIRKANFDIRPINGNADADAVVSVPPNVMDLRQNPLTLNVDEILRALIDSNTGAVAGQWVAALFSDGPVQPLGGQEIFTLRGTATTTLVAHAFTTLVTTWDSDLAVGRYQIVGLKAQSATSRMARIIFPGGGGPWRPGCLGSVADGDQTSPLFRYGALGLWGEFEATSMPDIEILASAGDTAEEIYLDLIRIG